MTLPPGGALPPRNVPPKLFLDSSALIAAVMSPRKNSPGRELLRLGELGAVDLRVSGEVLRDAEYVVRKRDPNLVTTLALLLDAADVAQTPDPSKDVVAMCHEMTGYRPDARVLAAAVECDCDIFVTHDAEHFLGNPLIGPPEVRAKVKNTRDALAWVRDLFRAEAEAEDEFVPDEE